MSLFEFVRMEVRRVATREGSRKLEATAKLFVNPYSGTVPQVLIARNLW